MPRIIRAFLLVLLLTPATLRSQTATATARSFFQAQTDKQWLAMAEFVDSTSLKALRGVADKMVETYAKMVAPATRATLDSAGAAGLVKLMDGLQSMMGMGSMFAYTFARVTDAAELQAMPDRELMARWFEAKSAGYLAGAAMGGMLKGMFETLPAAAITEARSSFDSLAASQLSWDVLGAITEGDGVAHVTYRVAGRTPPAPSGVLTFHRARGRWYIRFADPDDQLGHMAALQMAAVQASLRR